MTWAAHKATDRTARREPAPLRSLRIGLAVLAGGILVISVVLSHIPQRITYVPTADEQTVERLIAQHGCWTSSNAPENVLPGHAIVTLPEGEPERVSSDVGFAIWLEGAPGLLHAFCK